MSSLPRALAWARRGVSVLPLHNLTGRSCTCCGLRPRGQALDALRTDERRR